MCFPANTIWQAFSTQHISISAFWASITENTNPHTIWYYETRDAQNIRSFGQTSLLFIWQQKESSHRAVGITIDFLHAGLLCQSPGDLPDRCCHSCCGVGASGRPGVKNTACPLIHHSNEPPSPWTPFVPSLPIPVAGEDIGLVPLFLPSGSTTLFLLCSWEAVSWPHARCAVLLCFGGFHKDERKHLWRFQKRCWWLPC